MATVFVTGNVKAAPPAGNVPKTFTRPAAATLPNPMDNAFNTVVTAAFAASGKTAPAASLVGNASDTSFDAAVQAAYNSKNGMNAALTQ